MASTPPSNLKASGPSFISKGRARVTRVIVLDTAQFYSLNETRKYSITFKRDAKTIIVRNGYKHPIINKIQYTFKIQSSESPF